MSVLVKKTKRVKYYSGSYCRVNNEGKRDFRAGLLSLFFIIFCLLIVGRLFQLQVLDHDYYIALASGQHEIFQQLYPDRGAIYVQDSASPKLRGAGGEGRLVKTDNQYFPVAMNRDMNLLYAVPSEIEDPEAVLESLVKIFNLQGGAPEFIRGNTETPDPESIHGDLQSDTNATAPEFEVQESDQALIDNWREKLNKQNDPYEPLKHLVADEDIVKIEEYNLAGIYWTNEIARYYPEKNIGSQLIGFVGKQAENNMLKGYYGLESCYDKILAGEPGFLRSEKDTLGRWIATAGMDFRRAEPGSDIVLTVDKSIQYFACDQLNNFVVQFGAAGGTLAAMDPQTGRMLAVCNYPDFDPNIYNEVEDIGVFRNAALLDNYEPGSVFKPITMAAAIDSGKVTPFTGYQDTGELIISGNSIKNSDLSANGWQTMTQVLEKSLNTGAVFAARQIGLSEFKRYVEGFGFGRQTGIDLCHEAEGNIRSLNDENPIYLATASFGQGVTVTPMQLLVAFGAIANEGKLVQPYVVDSVVNSSGEVTRKTETIVINQVISPQTAKLLGGMLVSVVKSGHAKKAGVPGYLVAGKTGTAQVPDFEKGGYSDKTIHTFVGFAPFDQPKMVMVVKLDNPAAVNFAADSAAPLFSRVAKFILDYYEIPHEVK